jgi:hypothetical protein
MLKPGYLVHCDLFNKICLFVCMERIRRKNILFADVGCLPHTPHSWTSPPPSRCAHLGLLMLLLIWVFQRSSCSWKIQLWALAGVFRAEQLTSQPDPSTMGRVLLVFNPRGVTVWPQCWPPFHQPSYSGFNFIIYFQNLSFSLILSFSF